MLRVNGHHIDSNKLIKHNGNDFDMLSFDVLGLVNSAVINGYPVTGLFIISNTLVSKVTKRPV